MRFPFSHSISVYDHERVYHFTGIALLDWQKHLPSSAFRDKHTYSQTFAAACSVLFFFLLIFASCFMFQKAPGISVIGYTSKQKQTICLSMSFSLTSMDSVSQNCATGLPFIQIIGSERMIWCIVQPECTPCPKS